MDSTRHHIGLPSEYSWYCYGIQLVFLWNAWSQNKENVKYVSVDTTKHMIYTDIPHSTHNCIPHNLYYTTYYPWRVAVRITVMCVICGTSSDTLILQPYSILTPAAFHYDTTCIPLWHQLYSIITPVQQSINHQYSQATPTSCVIIDSTDNYNWCTSFSPQLAACPSVSATSWKSSNASLSEASEED